MDISSYGAMIRNRRQELGLSVPDMLDMINPSIIEKIPGKSAIAHVEAGRNWPSYTLATALAVVLSESRFIIEHQEHGIDKFKSLEVAHKLIAEHSFESAQVILDALIQSEKPPFTHETKPAHFLFELYLAQANAIGMNLWTISKKTKGIKLRKRERLVHALTWMNKAEKLLHSTAAPTIGRVRLFTVKAELYYRNFMFEECIEYGLQVDSLVRTYPKENNEMTSDLEQVNNLIARAYYRIGKMAHGDEWHRRYLGLVEEEREPLMHAAIYSARNECMINRLEFESACTFAEKILNLCAIQAERVQPNDAFAMAKLYVYLYLLVLSGKKDQAREWLIRSMHGDRDIRTPDGRFIGRMVEDYYVQRFEVFIDILFGAPYSKYERHIRTWREHVGEHEDFVFGGVLELSAIALLNEGKREAAIQSFKEAIKQLAAWGCRQDIESLIRRAERYLGIALRDERLIYLV